ncbi:MAG: DNA-methyltransferase [Gammaproteobacteria bacterium]
MPSIPKHQKGLPLDQLLPGDCVSLLRSLPDDCVDLIVSSPPYNLGKEYEAKKALDIYLGGQTTVLRECARVLRRSGSVFWQVGAFADAGVLIPLDVRFFPILESLGLVPRNRIVWVRQHGVHARRKFSCRHETLLWFTKSDEYVFNLDAIRVPQKYQNKKYWRGDRRGTLSCHPHGKNPGDIWVFRNVKHNHEEQTIHPCQFPEDLISRIVLSTTSTRARLRRRARPRRGSHGMEWAAGEGGEQPSGRLRRTRERDRGLAYRRALVFARALARRYGATRCGRGP